MAASRVWQAHLVAGGAAGLQPLGVVPPAVDLALLVEVDEIHQQLVARAAHEAAGVPAHAVARPRRKDRHVAAVDLTSALGMGGGQREEQLYKCVSVFVLVALQLDWCIQL